MPIIYLRGKSDYSTFQQICTQEKLPLEDTVFIFPGDPSQHENTTLYSIKSGSGLAAVATKLGSQFIPTLSLPIKEMNFNHFEGVTLATNAVRDLWRAVGFGLHIALPIRPYNDNSYFDDSLVEIDNVKFEPNFWSVAEEQNKPLANFYLHELKELQAFCNERNPQTQITLLKNLQQRSPILYEGYLYGQDQKENKQYSLPLEKWFWSGQFIDALKKANLLSLKKAMCEPLNNYISWWKLKIFQHHHDGRARAVKNAIMIANSEAEIANILRNQCNLFSETSLENHPFEQAFDLTTAIGRFSTVLKNKPVGNKTSGYLNAIVQAKKTFNEMLSESLKNLRMA